MHAGGDEISEGDPDVETLRLGSARRGLPDDDDRVAERYADLETFGLGGVVADVADGADGVAEGYAEVETVDLFREEGLLDRRDGVAEGAVDLERLACRDRVEVGEEPDADAVDLERWTSLPRDYPRLRDQALA
ncbi:MAG: hypothetical protein ACNA7R_20140, partial [Natronococcus sp.]